MDSQLLGRLIDEHAAALELYARQWCEAPEDVVQEAYLKLATLETLPDNPAAWLFRVVRNGAINAGVADRRRRRHETDAAGVARSWFQGEPATAGTQAIDPAAAADELQALPVEQREVIVARLWGGLTFEQIAQVSGISSSTAHRLYRAGLAALRERLEVQCLKSRTNRN